MRRVVVTGMGIVSSIGNNTQEVLSSLHDAKSQTLLESQFDSEEFVRSGIFFLGVPLVITLCLIGIHRWRESQRQELLDPGPEPSDPA